MEPRQIGKIKKFDQKLYDKYDIPARIKLKQLLPGYVFDNDDIYGEDMKLNIPGCKYKFLELQVCVKWISDKFPYERPFVYSRKAGFSDDTLFLILDKHMTCGLIFDKKSIYEKPRRLKKYSRYFVYEVPWNRVLPVNFDDFDFNTVCLYC